MSYKIVKYACKKCGHIINVETDTEVKITLECPVCGGKRFDKGD